jgi:hypothetical protein
MRRWVLFGGEWGRSRCELEESGGMMRPGGDKACEDIGQSWLDDPNPSLSQSDQWESILEMRTVCVTAV